MVVDSGTLMTRSLVDVVSKHDFVIDSKNLITVLVVVPKQVLYEPFIATVQSSESQLHAVCIVHKMLQLTVY